MTDGDPAGVSCVSGWAACSAPFQPLAFPQGQNCSGRGRCQGHGDLTYKLLPFLQREASAMGAARAPCCFYSASVSLPQSCRLRWLSPPRHLAELK